MNSTVCIFLCTMGFILPTWGRQSGVQSDSPSATLGADTTHSFLGKNLGSNSDEILNIVLFDGVCNFCNKWVDIILRLDTGKKIRFCALQSPKGMILSSKIGRKPDELTSVILIKSINNHEIYAKSDAILKVTQQLGFFWYLFSSFCLASPSFMRDWFYDVIARNRYSILGKRDQCRCAGSGSSERFI
jgi:predicted DCC family thiol-disulfide oxidoreductase YuxK